MVVFTEGPIARNKLLLDPSESRFWVHDHWLLLGADRLAVREYLSQVRPGEALARPPAWGLGGQAAVTQNLKMVAAEQPGTILAAMTVRYGTQAEIDAYERSVRTKNSTFTGLVTVKTSGQ